MGARTNVVVGVIPRHRLSPEMAKPEKPTARTRKVMATPLVWEKPTTSSRVASIPKPVEEHIMGVQSRQHKHSR